jgi:hypothetical protein
VGLREQLDEENEIVHELTTEIFYLREALADALDTMERVASTGCKNCFAQQELEFVIRRVKRK